MTAAFSYEDSVRRVIGGLKFRNRRAVVELLVECLVSRLESIDFDCVTYMPSSLSGKRERGYEPGRLLASGVARRLRLPMRRMLVRIDDVPQRGRSRSERLRGPTLRLLPNRHFPFRLLIIDDVCTTGASLAAAADVLLEGGVGYVEAAVIASTPAPVHVG